MIRGLKSCICPHPLHFGGVLDGCMVPISLHPVAADPCVAGGAGSGEHRIGAQNHERQPCCCLQSEERGCCQPEPCGGDELAAVGPVLAGRPLASLPRIPGSCPNTCGSLLLQHSSPWQCCRAEPGFSSAPDRPRTV